MMAARSFVEERLTQIRMNSLRERDKWRELHQHVQSKQSIDNALRWQVMPNDIEITKLMPKARQRMYATEWGIFHRTGGDNRDPSRKSCRITTDSHGYFQWEHCVRRPAIDQDTYHGAVFVGHPRVHNQHAGKGGIPKRTIRRQWRNLWAMNPPNRQRTEASLWSGSFDHRWPRDHEHEQVDGLFVGWWWSDQVHPRQSGATHYGSAAESAQWEVISSSSLLHIHRGSLT